MREFFQWLLSSFGPKRHSIEMASSTQAAGFAEFRDWVFSMTLKVGREFDPDEDWAPMFFALRNDVKNQVDAVPCDLSTQESKDQFANVLLPSVVCDPATRAYALVFTAWIGKPPADELEYARRTGVLVRPVADLENKWEGLKVYVGDAVHFESYIARIKRVPNSPPLVEDWEREDPAEASGRFPEAFKTAIARNSTRPV
jgi:hypothetical protein